MKIIEPSHEIMTPIDGESGRNMLRLIELAARNCYKSEDAITCESHSLFVKKIATVFKHESVIEHASVTVRFICDRGVTHEIVRHRIAACSQESTRYCNYSKDKFGKEITVIRPLFWSPDDPKTCGRFFNWRFACEQAQAMYFALLDAGASAQEARSVLPNSLKTEIIMTANLREWQHIFRLRCSSKAHPQMQQLMKPLLVEFKQHLPELFEGVNPE
jgi:thymidylate synthase (FAD)